MKKQSFSKKMNYLLADEETETAVTNESVDDCAVATIVEHEPVLSSTVPVGDSVIGLNAKITGEVNLNENLQVLGQIDGNVTTTENIKICGTVNGNISAANVTVDGGIVNGNIISTATVFLSENSSVTGDIETVSLIISGNVKGNIKATEILSLKASAAVNGDIAAAVMSMDEGAKINGKIAIAK